MAESTRAASSQSYGDLIADVDWKRSVAFGVGAWVVGVVASLVVVAVSGAAEFPVTGSASTLEVSVWVFYSSMGGLLEVSTSFGELSLGTVGYGVLQYRTINSDFFGVAAFVHYVIPPFVLVLSGFLLARAHDTGASGRGGRRHQFVGGISLVAAFAFVTLLVSMLFDSSGINYEGIRLLLVAVAYPAVFGGIGASLASGVKLRSLWGLLGGVGAFLIGYVVFFLVESPSPGDYPVFGGSTKDFGPVLVFMRSHGFTGGSIPEWWVLLPLLFAGAFVAWRADASDPIAGAGQGVRIVWGYLPLAFLGSAAWFLAYFEYTTRVNIGGKQTLINQANVVFGGVVPEMTLVGGILWPAVLGAIGGAVLVLVRNYRGGHGTPP